jgi:hypothetical protein
MWERSSEGTSSTTASHGIRSPFSRLPGLSPGCGGVCSLAAASDTSRGIGCDAMSPDGFRLSASAIRGRSRALAFGPKVGAGCGNAARPDLCGGRRAIGVPTATNSLCGAERSQQPALRWPGSALRRTPLRPLRFRLENRAGPCTRLIDRYGLRPENVAPSAPFSLTDRRSAPHGPLRGRPLAALYSGTEFPKGIDARRARHSPRPCTCSGCETKLIVGHRPPEYARNAR